MDAARVTLVPWTDADLAVLQDTNTPDLTRYLGGPESPGELGARHAEYLSFARSGGGAAFRVLCDGSTAGYAAWWDERLEGRRVCEIGCSIVPAWHGRGVATAACRAVLRDAAASGHTTAVGFADPANTISRALCRRLGFAEIGDGFFGDDPVTVLTLDLAPFAP